MLHAATGTRVPGRRRRTLLPRAADLFPVDTLRTVHPRKVLFADFNADGRPDMFISSHGWDADPFPGEQNRLYLSRPEGGWRDATANLPQLSDFSHTSAVGDISGRGLIDIFVGNGYWLAGIAPYFLLNTGSGQFTQTRTNIPAGNNQLLDPFTAHHFLGATLADLDGDGLPELIVTADSSSSRDRLRRTTILWNRAGVFTEADTTQLPLPGIFANTHIDLDVQRIDVNQDGLPDLVLVGTQGRPFYDGWFVQILVNKGNRQFVDETAAPRAAGGGLGRSRGSDDRCPLAGVGARPRLQPGRRARLYRGLPRLRFYLRARSAARLAQRWRRALLGPQGGRFCGGRQ